MILPQSLALKITLHTEEETYLAICETVQHSNQESLKSHTMHIIAHVHLEQNDSCQACLQFSM